MMNNIGMNHTNDKHGSIAIYLYGHSISLDGASELLELVPTKARSRGDVRTTSAGSEIVQKIGFWEYHTNAKADQIASSLTGLVNRVKCESIVGKAGIEKAELDVFVPFDICDEQRGFSFELPSELLSRLATLGFDLIVTTR